MVQKILPKQQETQKIISIGNKNLKIDNPQNMVHSAVTDGATKYTSRNGSSLSRELIQ